MLLCLNDYGNKTIRLYTLLQSLICLFNMELLATAKTYLESLKASDAYIEWQKMLPAGDIWQSNYILIDKILRLSKDAPEAVRLISDTVLYQINTHEPERLNVAVDWYIGELGSRGIDIKDLSHAVSDHNLWPEKLLVKRGGKRYTPDFFRIFNFAAQITKYYPNISPYPTILELGGGLGHLARLMKIMHPGALYTIVDLPETLIFAYMFLRLNFPDKKIILASSEEEARRCIALPYDYLLIPNIFSDALKGEKFNLFINTCSLGEMSNDTVSYWMTMIQQHMRIENLYMVNRFLNVNRPELNQSRKHENTCMLLFDRKWEIKHWQLQPDYLSCPYQGFTHSRYLEVFMQRNQDISDEEAAKYNDILLQDIKLQEWIPAGNISSSWLNASFHVDTSVYGIIFKLWEALRLQPNAASILAMLQFLDTRSRGYGMEFEEAFYLEEKLKELLIAEPHSPPMLWLMNRQTRRALYAAIEDMAWGRTCWFNRGQESSEAFMNSVNKIEKHLHDLWKQPDINLSPADESQWRMDSIFDDK